MSLVDREYVERLERRIQELEHARSSRIRRAAAIVTPLVVLGALVASAPSTGLGAVELRLRALESLISTGPDGAAQARGPFQVLDAGGRVLFSVARPTPNAVNVVAAGRGAELSLMNGAGKAVAGVGVAANGSGRVTSRDADGTVAAELNDEGLNVRKANGEFLATVTRGGGAGRVAVWRNYNMAIELTADPDGGRLAVSDVDGRLRAEVDAQSGIGIYEGREKNVALLTSRQGRGIVGVAGPYSNSVQAEMLADSGGGGRVIVRGPDGKTAIGLLGRSRTLALGNSSGKTVAEMTVHPTGYGLFQIWDGGSTPLALMGKSSERGAGIVQISNGRTVISSLTSDGSGDGYLQINDAAGTPMLEAGVQDNGLGTVRAGPQFECLHRMSQGIQRLPDCIRGKK